MQVITNALSGLPVLVSSVVDLTQPHYNSENLMSMAKLADAALAALGGFEENVKPGCSVWVRNYSIEIQKQISVLELFQTW